MVQDPEGLFIRRWVPELARVPLPYLAEPWKMDASIQHMAGCWIGKDYPLPIVDDKQAMKAAKDRMYGLRETREARQEASSVQARHGSRKSGLSQSTQRRTTAAKSVAKLPASASPQRDLFA
jgi:deoxyribodipyrimidine photo-lyase